MKHYVSHRVSHHNTMFHNCKGSLQGRLAATSRIHKCLTDRDLLNKNEEILITRFEG